MLSLCHSVLNEVGDMVQILKKQRNGSVLVEEKHKIEKKGKSGEGRRG